MCIPDMMYPKTNGNGFPYMINCGLDHQCLPLVPLSNKVLVQIGLLLVKDDQGGEGEQGRQQYEGTFI